MPSLETIEMFYLPIHKKLKSKTSSSIGLSKIFFSSHNWVPIESKILCRISLCVYFLKSVVAEFALVMIS